MPHVVSALPLKESLMINSQTGNITLSRPLDHETTPTYKLLVAAISEGTMSTTLVIVEVMDVNEQPVFGKEVYEVCG